MSDPIKGRKQGRKPEDPEKSTWLSAKEVSKLLTEVSARHVRSCCAAGLYPGSRLAHMNGGEGWQIPLECLPGAARARYFEQQAKPKAPKAKPGVTQQDSVSPNEPERAAANDQHVSAATSDQAYREALWAGFEKAETGRQQEARRRFEIVLAFKKLEQAGGRQQNILRVLKEQFGKGTSKTTIWRYLETIEGHEQGDWLPLLLPEWKGKTVCAPFTDEAWEYIRADYFRQSKPSLSACIRRARKLAVEKGWQIPSYDTVKAKADAVPHDEKVFLREGPRALETLYPAQKRLFTMNLHDIWCADGHKADVFVIDETGEIFRPMVMAWMELRSRTILGYAVAKSETSDLVRRALHQAITRSNAVPREALLDNGRAFASKEITGGVPNRYRFNVNEDDPLGALPLLGIGVIWATPGRGQVKPIEPFWRHLTEMAKRREFEKAYCGNTPDAKPENFDQKNAVPLAVFKRVLDETMADYHVMEHSGNGMNGKTPLQVYEELRQSTSIRQPTTAQIRICLLTAEATKLKGEEGSIQIGGNRYWSPQVGELNRKRTYTVRQNPEDAREPVMLYLNEVFICEVPLFGDADFRDRAAGKEHNSNRRKWMKSVKNSDEALAKLRKSESRMFMNPEDTDPEIPAMSRPKIAEPVRPRLQMPIVTKPAEEEDDTPLLSPEQFMEMLARKEAGRGR